ncbi:putative transcriptional regulatory protein [Ceratocystis platani]|uniref:Putative transcriptional regulatory protein n=1 Tax=Ceratocystis fimbriata f. sp. platani TaxID=88771 RepID=A0A0F8BMM2_CERFI|nr:putative transcriptional regulatory protein [Ceratocystis platani]
MYGGANVATSPPSRYLALAKEMTPELYDKADIDSIRALCLLAMVHQSSCPDQAYLYIGSAARIAYTLGLHIKKETHARPIFQRQLELRIFCTIYLLDMDIALTHGYPPALSEADAIKDLHLTTEQILYPGSNIPPGYQVVASQLSQLSRRISALLYITPDSGGRTRFLADVMGCVSTLHTWMDDLPLPLRNCKDATQCHGRSIAILHLRYYSTMILATRPFLLHTALGPGESGIEAKRKTFQDLAMLCIDAASQSLDILQHMQVNGLISSLVSLDATFLIEDIQVFLLVVSANTRRESGLDVSHKAYACLEILQSMEQVQGVKSTLDKALAQLREYGIIDASNGLMRTTA